MRLFIVLSFLLIVPSHLVLAGPKQPINAILLNKLQHEKKTSCSQTGLPKSRRADLPQTEYVEIWQELMESLRYDHYIHPKPVKYLMVETNETVADTIGSVAYTYDPSFGYTGFTLVEDGYSAETVITYNQKGQISKILIVTQAEEDASKYLDTITFIFTFEGNKRLTSIIQYSQYESGTLTRDQTYMELIDIDKDANGLITDVYFLTVVDGDTTELTRHSYAWHNDTLPSSITKKKYDLHDKSGAFSRIDYEYYPDGKLHTVLHSDSSDSEWEITAKDSLLFNPNGSISMLYALQETDPYVLEYSYGNDGRIKEIVSKEDEEKLIAVYTSSTISYATDKQLVNNNKRYKTLSIYSTKSHTLNEWQNGSIYGLNGQKVSSQNRLPLFAPGCYIYRK